MNMSLNFEGAERTFSEGCWCEVQALPELLGGPKHLCRLAILRPHTSHVAVLKTTGNREVPTTLSSQSTYFPLLTEMIK